MLHLLIRESKTFDGSYIPLKFSLDSNFICSHFRWTFTITSCPTDIPRCDSIWSLNIWQFCLRTKQILTWHVAWSDTLWIVSGTILVLSGTTSRSSCLLDYDQYVVLHSTSLDRSFLFRATFLFDYEPYEPWEPLTYESSVAYMCRAYHWMWPKWPIIVYADTTRTNTLALHMLGLPPELPEKDSCVIVPVSHMEDTLHSGR